jgi:DNA-cytosine methyltransferase
MNTINKPKRSLVSLFAGCGGSSLGYKQAGFDIRLAVEWDMKAADVYRRNFPETSIFGGDIADLTAEEALEITGLQPGELDVLDGSPPCQGFSTAGQRKFTDSRNRLFEEYVRMIDVFRPKMLVMENVSGLRKGKMRLMFAEMTIALKQAGYKVSCRELNAWWYGVPQDRRRLIWVGVREDLDMEPGHPDPTVTRPVSVREALGILYDANIKTGVQENCMCRPGGKHCAAQPRPIDGPSQTQNASFRLKIEAVGTKGKPGQNGPNTRSGDGLAFTMDASQRPQIQLRNPDFENKWKDGDGVGPTLMSSRPPTISIETPGVIIDTDQHKDLRDNPVEGLSPTLRNSLKPRFVVEGFESNNQGYREGSFRDADLPAQTLGTSERPKITGSFTFPCNADRDGKPLDQPVGTMAAIRPPSVTDGKAVRYLTIEESKTLQGFPEWFQLNENEYRFVGNSVCPPMAEALGRHLLRLLEE